MAVLSNQRRNCHLPDARKLLLPMAPGGWQGHCSSQPSLTGTSFPYLDLKCSQAPRFSPQKEFPEILKGINKSFALQLVQTLMVRKFWIPKPTCDRGLILAACPPGCGSSNTEGHSSTIRSFPPCTPASWAGEWRVGPLSFLPFIFP